VRYFALQHTLYRLAATFPKDEEISMRSSALIADVREKSRNRRQSALSLAASRQNPQQ
jgi:hypothetical protein